MHLRMIERDSVSTWWCWRQNSVSSASGSTGVSGSVRVDEVHRPRRRRQRLADQRLLRAEVAEQRHFVDAGLLGDAPRRGAARPVLGEDLERRLQQLFAGSIDMQPRSPGHRLMQALTYMHLATEGHALCARRQPPASGPETEAAEPWFRDGAA